MDIKGATNGAGSTEYEVQKSTDIWAAVGLILSTIIAAGPSILDSLQEQETVCIIAGACLGACTVAYKLFSQLGYIKARTALKTAMLKEDTK